MRRKLLHALRRRMADFGRDRRATSAVEFAIVASPFFLLMMGILQIGIFYMTQSALDAALVKTADSLRNSWLSTGTTTNPTTGIVTANPWTAWTTSALKSTVATSAGGLVRNDSSLSVEIRQLANLTSAVTAITDGVTDFGSASSSSSGSAGSILVLRAQASAITFAPGLGSLTSVRSSVILRRQGT